MQAKVLLILVILVGTSWAQGPMGEGGMSPRNMDAIRIWKLTEVLQLTEEQVVSFLPLVQIHERELRGIQKELVALSKETEKYLENEDVSQKEVDKLIKKYSDKLDQIHKIKHDFLKSLSKHLTPEQQLLYLGFETRFRSELREYMKKERRSGPEHTKYKSKRK